MYVRMYVCMYVCMYVLIHANDEIIFRSDKHFCWMDGYAAFRKGEIVSGRLGKTIVYIHTYKHKYKHTYIYTYKSVYACICIRVHKIALFHIHVHTYIHKFFHTYKLSCIHTNILVFILGKKTLGGDTKCGLLCGK